VSAGVATTTCLILPTDRAINRWNDDLLEYQKMVFYKKTRRKPIVFSMIAHHVAVKLIFEWNIIPALGIVKSGIEN
jgi:hypothetical protein